MLTKFNRLILVLIVVALALYIVLLNHDAITVYLTPGSPIEANAGAILIGAFVLGMLFSAVVSLWFGLKSYFRERGLRSKDRQRQAFYEGMLKARSHLSAHEWRKAKDQWELLVKKDPTDIISRVELSRSIEGLAQEGKEALLEALRTLDSARAADSKNIEVLFRAAEINLALNNRTAALDNLALILYHHPNRRAALMARETSEELGRIEDAFEYQRQLEKLSESSDDFSTAITRLNFKKLLQEVGTDPLQLREQVRSFIKKNPSFAPALVKLAEIEAEAGKLDEAAQLYVRASKSGGNIKDWHMAARLWLKANLPDKAIAGAKILANESSGVARITAEIELIRLYVALNMLEEARKLIDGFPFLLKREDVKRTKELMLVYLSLKGLCLSRMGEHQLSAEVFKRLCELDMEMQDFLKDHEQAPSTEAPAPRLSTP